MHDDLWDRPDERLELYGGLGDRRDGRLELEVASGAVFAVPERVGLCDRRSGWCKSTGSAIFDQLASNTFRRWRCRPGVYEQVYVPITFTLQGAQL
ncbi:MAG: hypothetical protein H0W66_02150 [Chthoniobacterales bacterium]|nr:hypothetical protein [Chthoniobacterales bacterium]